jgi:hypothetical protein
MNSRQFNGIYRPLVKAAWLQHCTVKHASHANDKAAYDLWYRQSLHVMTSGRYHSTAGIPERMQRHLIDEFRKLSDSSDQPTIIGWSDSQGARFCTLARAAYRAAQMDGETAAFSDWLDTIMRRHHHHRGDHPSAPDGYWMSDRTKTFDALMADMAIRTNDEYWLRHTAEQGEIRIRWQLCRFLVDLDAIEPTHHHEWSYVVGIYRQSGMLPDDLADCPAETLWRVLQMLDTHIRRLCRDLGIRPIDLPTRSTHPHDHGIAISAKAVRLHIGHELEHVEDPVHVATGDDEIPF